jgi:hypothetical protein
MSTAAHPRGRAGSAMGLLGLALVGAAAAIAVTIAAADGAITGSYVLPGLFVVVAVGLLISDRYEITLAVVLLYLGLLDGYIKLKTNSDVATLGRDVLLYAVVIGAVVRLIVRKQRVEVPPLTLGVVAWIVIVLAQVFNPDSQTYSHSLAALRPHLEFVPLFFFGYALLRSPRRLEGFFVLLIVVAIVNGIVGLIQFNLTPEQFASWGPGYHDRVFGTGAVSGRSFAAGASERVRPFGLGSDVGFAGICGMLAAPAAIALISGLHRRFRLAVLALVAAPFIVAAAVTSQTRVAVVSAIVAVVVYVVLTATSRRVIGVVLGVAVLGVAGYAIGHALTSGDAAGSGPAFSRYDSIAPGSVVGTTVDYRKDTLALIPDYIASFPLGAGIGSVGPAGSSDVFGGPRQLSLNAESEYNFLLIEVGVPGALILLFLNARLLAMTLALRRLVDSTLRGYLMALGAVVIALFAAWVIGPMTANTPASPFFWFTAGGLAYWYGELRAGRLALRPRSLRAALRAR